MGEPDRRPTAQEIEELIDLVRRDPSSPAFIDLAEAYLALGRPKDAIKVGNVGLEASPDNLEGRVVLARAFASLHMWKEAQGELLRVVKVDRSNRLGFALLGEVLLRRNDFERAVPVLQHAQNLDPTSPSILSMLKRARQNQPLDPPAPVPQPVPPRGETNYGLSLEEAAPPAPPPPRATPPRAPAVPASSPVAPTMAIQPAAFEEPPRPKKPTAAPPPPMSVEGVRPRVISGAKPQNAASAALRQSAAVGETYLNDLLTGGLLDVAGVRVPDADFDLRPDRRWGRSTRRAFIFLFVVLVLGIGGGGTWYWWTEKQKSEAVARLQKESKESIGAGDFAGLEESLKKLGNALEKDNSNLITFSYVVETAGIEALLYGTDTNRVDQALKAVAKDIKPGQTGARELVIGKAAVELSRLGSLEAPASTLAEVRKMLDDYLAKSADDKWAVWLKGRAMLAAGERKGAVAILKSAADGDAGLPIAMIDLADLLVDEGKLDEAIPLYDKALAKSKDHPLAVLGKAMALAESTVDSNAAIDDLSVKLDKNLGPRVSAYRNLAFALAQANIEDYVKSNEALKKATAKPPVEPRFWARVAWAHYIKGDFASAANARGKIAWYGKNKAEDDPTVQLVDAALLIASGLPDKALDLASKIEGIRPRLLRAYAQLDLKDAKGAIESLDVILEKAKDNLEAQILKEEAKMVAATSDKDRTAASEALEKLARKAKSKLGRHALGMGYFLTGNLKDAQTQLEQAVADVNEEAPNPLSYRTRTALAEILLANGDIPGAGKQLDQALATNSGYFPTRVMQARVVLRNGEPDRAIDLLTAVIKELEKIPPDVTLMQIEAACASKKTTNKQKDEAKAAVPGLKGQVADDELARVAAVCDPKLAAELGVSAGASAEKPAEKPKTPKKDRRRRR
ncbi:MAG: tetratricopeptide repeat protein [Kofleriaceae bacterium]|nr:tetratricopeptide repeat protein [Kofleriaceae bacterium]